MRSFGTLMDLGGGCHAWVQGSGGWCVNNCGFVLDKTGSSILVDTCATELRSRALKDAVGEPDYLVNTHFHGDHTFGNHLFTSSRLINTMTTSELSRLAGDSLCKLWPQTEWGVIGWGKTEVIFSGSLTINLGSVEARLIDVGPAHSPSDLIAWVESAGVLFAGDIVWNGVTPFLLMGSVAGTLDALRLVEELGPRIIVPGHGPVGGLEIVRSTRSYVEWLQAVTEDGRSRGWDCLELSRSLKEQRVVPDLLDPERLLPNLERAWAEADGLPAGAPIDVEGAFGRMVEHADRYPVCLA